MKIEKKGKEIIIRHILKSNETYKIFEGNKIKTITILKKPQKLQGISSSCEDGHDVLFVDYDNSDINVVLRDYNIIQSKFKLPQAYLFKTKKGSYHVICLIKMLPKRVYTILSYTHCDNAYIDMPLRNYYRSWILRIGNKKGSKKPKFLRVIGDKNIIPQGKVSKAHLNFLSKLYKNIKHPNYKRGNNLSYLDNSSKIYLQEYES